MPAAPGAGRQDVELAAGAVDKVAIGIPFFPNSRRKNRVILKSLLTKSND